MPSRAEFPGTRSLYLVVAALLVGPSVGCEFKCGTGGHEKRLEKSLAKQLAKQLDRKVKKVKCPSDIDAKEGDLTRCMATFADGEKLAIEVEWTDDVGGFSWKTKPKIEALMKQLSKLIGEGLARKYEAEFDGVSCPDKVAIKKGATFECVATIPGGSKLPVKVVWTTDEGGYEYTDKGIVLLDKLEGIVAAQLIEKKTPGTVDCHGKIRASEPGSDFVCDIAFADGTQGKIKVVVKDWSGNIAWDYLGPE